MSLYGGAEVLYTSSNLPVGTPSQIRIFSDFAGSIIGRGNPDHRSEQLRARPERGEHLQRRYDPERQSGGRRRQ
ncbi:MAG: hypothetical protein WDM85_04925 [Caulobacteraceae bacterium]